MWTNNLPHLLVDILATIFVISAITNMTGARYLRERFRQWRYPRRFYLVMGVLQLFTALLLAVPQLRIWGIVFAGLITFFWVVTLLNRRQWSWAAGGMLMLMALAPASLAIY
jgi:predicted lysophospholipase L1 biosynthesis ABC-type transport system permease subunit